ncbi:helix-turn-helix domain-containing protein [Mesorhizobium sp. A556]
MSVHAMAWAKKQKTGSATRKLVLLTIADYANDDGVAWPSQQTIAAESELTDRSIRRALAELEKRDLLRREKRPSLPSGQLQSDKIHLNLAAIGQLVRRSPKPKSPADFHARPADTESGKPPRNYLTQGGALTSQGRALTYKGGMPASEDAL